MFAQLVYSDFCWSYRRLFLFFLHLYIFLIWVIWFYTFAIILSSIRTQFFMCICLRDAHCPPWRKKKCSVWAPLEDFEPGELWATASRVELLLAPGVLSLRWSLWNGLVAAERKKAHLIFWTCSATLRPNSKRYSHKSHFWLFQWTVPQIKWNWVHSSWIAHCFRYIKIKLWGNPLLIG